MSNNVNLNTFPSTKSEALTMLYLQSQDLSGKSPSDIVELYISTNNEIRETFGKQPRKSKKF